MFAVQACASAGIARSLSILGRHHPPKVFELSSAVVDMLCMLTSMMTGSLIVERLSEGRALFTVMVRRGNPALGFRALPNLVSLSG